MLMDFEKGGALEEREMDLKRELRGPNLDKNGVLTVFSTRRGPRRSRRCHDVKGMA